MEIVESNSFFWVVSKPFSQEFHGQEGILSKMRENFAEVYGVHRLDKETSGLMLFAKTKETQKELSELFRNRQIDKVYFALSDQRPKKKMGWVIGDLVKSRRGSYRLARTKRNPSRTFFQSKKIDEKLWLLVLFPHTGQTHQLRVVARSLGSPILGDSRYGGTPSQRMFLHACSLKFDWKNVSRKFISLPFRDHISDEVFSELKIELEKI